MPLPQRIELPENRIDQRGSCGPNSEFKIPSPIGFSAQPRSGEVRTAQVHAVGVDNDRLEMQPRAATNHQILGKCSFKLAQCGRAGCPRMKEPDFDALPRQAPEYFDDRDRATRSCFGDQHRLEIRRRDVQADRSVENSLADYLVKILGIGHQIRGA